jgi:hypothetical protein
VRWNSAEHSIVIGDAHDGSAGDQQQAQERQRGAQLAEHDRPRPQQRHLQRHERLALALAADGARREGGHQEQHQHEHDQQHPFEHQAADGGGLGGQQRPERVDPRLALARVDGPQGEPEQQDVDGHHRERATGAHPLA